MLYYVMFLLKYLLIIRSNFKTPYNTKENRAY